MTKIAKVAAGRASELAGEDPVLAGTYAAECLRGLQRPDPAGRPLVLAHLKHLAAYSRETGRNHDSYAISPQDLHETYLPQCDQLHNPRKLRKLRLLVPPLCMKVPVLRAGTSGPSATAARAASCAPTAPSTAPRAARAPCS